MGCRYVSTTGDDKSMGYMDIIIITEAVELAVVILLVNEWRTQTRQCKSFCGGVGDRWWYSAALIFSYSDDALMREESGPGLIKLQGGR